MTTIDRIHVTPEGRIEFRLNKTGDPKNPQWHRSAVDPGRDVDEQMRLVNAHLVKMGYEPVADWSALRACTFRHPVLPS